MKHFSALQVVGSVESDEAQRWHKLLEHLDVDRLTDTFLGRVLQIADYRNGMLPASEIRRTGASSFAALIEGLRHDVDEARVEEVRLAQAIDVGVSRARANIPIESLMTAIRLDFSILWTELTALAAESDAALLVRHTENVWHVVDSYASQTQAAYVAERQRMLNEAASIRQGYVAAIFGQESPGPEMMARISAEIGIEQDTALGVAVALDDDAAALRIAVAVAARAGSEILTHPMANELIVFWPADDRAGSAAREIVARIRGQRCGLVERTAGLASLASAARFARELASLMEDDDDCALTLQQSWTRIARLRLAEAGMPVASDVEKALAGCGPVERERLVEAAKAYLATGSVAGSVRRLFCHRNTLMNRLRRFTDLTGIDVTVPHEAARLVVAWS
ncbi:helix-turn-helix domain-containing protein [Arthrobacter sp. H14]|uniref:helix-turn-helix domain-containing protein n=1 Tax=Arthrobacter sp. H14 TaxID=1312959 RepID=UPI00068609A7|nr:helix-turn-helix domain-containing protein [Arthrobacter sp. H14]